MTDKPAEPKQKRKINVPRILKIITTVLVVVAVIAAMGTVWVKDSSNNNPAYCATCHEDPYYEGWADADSLQLAHTHQQMGISCQTCHDRTLGESLGEWKDYIVGYEVPLRERRMPNDTCFQCHDSYTEIVPLTDPTVTGAERNPHAGHWGELECGICHNMHRDSVDYCAGCHEPVTESPGWTLPEEES